MDDETTGPDPVNPRPQLESVPSHDPGVTPGRTVFIGDVHGCSGALDALLRRLDLGPRDRLLLTGDAFTKGPEPLRVWATLQRLEPEMVMGNHERTMLKKLRKLPPAEYPNEPKVAPFAPIAAALRDYLEALPYVIEDDAFVLVHAGINPDTGLAGTSKKEFVSIRTWPPRDSLYGPRWHDAFEPEDDRVVVFGHDAPGGLVRKLREDGQPYVIGLDTGCVYGGRLTAWILKSDTFVQVECPEAGPG